MTLHAYGTRVAISPIKPETTTASGLFIPEHSQGENTRGIVQSIGDRVRADLKVGDTVAFKPFSGAAVTHEGEELHFLEEVEILFVFEGEADHG